MSMNDPVADMLTRIRNANMIGRDCVDVFGSRIILGIAKVMKEYGFINGFKEIQDGPKKTIRIYLRFGPMNKKVINSIKRGSKGGKRVYKKVNEIGKIMGGMGISVISTSKGILSNVECKKEHVGGELLCTIW